jgi:glutamate racemase
MIANPESFEPEQLDPDQPIGMFDSGVGGFTVLREVKKILPHEQVVYFGDTANAPYGERPPELIRAWAKNSIDFLLAQGVKAVTIACNVSSSVLTREDLAAYAIPIFGLVYNGATAALQKTRSGRIGVLATTATVTTGSYMKVIHGFNPEAEVTQSACPKFVPFTESGVFEGDEVDAAVREYVAPLKQRGVDTVIYGCTHYPLLEGAIKRQLDGVMLVDPAVEIAEELAAYLHNHELLRRAAPADDLIFASKLNEHFFNTAERFLGRDIRALSREVSLNQP